MVHVSKDLDIPHINQYWNQSFIKRVGFDIVPGNTRDILVSQRAGLLLIPIKDILVRLKCHYLCFRSGYSFGFYNISGRFCICLSSVSYKYREFS